MSNGIETSLSICAIFISLVSLLATFWQADLTRMHNMLSVRPRVLATHYLSGPDDKNGIYISNSGLGPAIITNLQVVINGKTFNGLGRNKWPEALNSIHIGGNCFLQAWPLEESILKSSEEVALLEVAKEKPPVCTQSLLKLLVQYGVKIKINYKSMYDEPGTYEAMLKIEDDAAKNLLRLSQEIERQESNR
jgi:hypothetical protein